MPRSVRASSRSVNPKHAFALTFPLPGVYKLEHPSAHQRQSLPGEMHAQDRVGVHEDELELGAWYSRIGVSWRDERPITAHAPEPLLMSAQDQLALRRGLRTGTPCELDEADGVELALLELIIWRPGGMMNVG